MNKRLLTGTIMNRLLVLIWALTLCCGVSAVQAATATYKVELYFHEPDCAPRDSIFLGTFVYDDVTKTVTNLKGILSESMTGDPHVAFDPAKGPGNFDTMTWLGLDNVSNAVWGATQSYQGTTYTQAQIQALHEKYGIAGPSAGLNNQLLPSWPATDNNAANKDASLGGTFAITFKNTSTNTFSTMFGDDGWSPQAGVNVGGVYYNFPKKPQLTWNPANASALIFVPDSLSPANTESNPLILEWNESTFTGSKGVAHTSYTDFVLTNHPGGNYDFGGGMMGAIGMTGTSAYAYGAVGTMSGFPYRQVITIADTAPEPFSFTPATDVALSSVVESNVITVAGLNTPADISITGGEYAVSSAYGPDNVNVQTLDASSNLVYAPHWSAYTSTPGFVVNGHQIKVHLTSAASASSTLTATLTIGGASSSFDVTTTATPTFNVPNVVSLTQAAAQAAVTAATLTIGTVTQSYSSTVPTGQVISQTPAAGTSVALGSAVDLVVSKGTAPVEVPNVVGLEQAAAQSAVTAATLANGTVTQAYSSTVASGLIISQSPASGTSVLQGTSVYLVVSNGPAPVAVPDVVSQPQSAAQAVVTAATLANGSVTLAYNSTVASGLVISQSPAAGSSVLPGTSVDLTVSKGQAPVAVPNLVGQTEDIALTKITATNLTVGTVTTANSATISAGLVISQTPADGVSVAPGSAVHLVVSIGPAAGVALPGDGDINGDGRLDITDALLALQIAIGNRTATAAQLHKGDVAPFVAGKPQPDGIIDDGDVLVILRRIIGLLTW